MQLNCNATFMQKYVNNFNLLTSGTPYLYSFVKDLDSNYIAASQGFVALTTPHILDLAPNAQLANQFSPSLVKNKDKYVQIIRQQDEKVLAELKPYSWLHVYSNKEIYKVNKSPVINPETNQVVGLMGYMESLVLPNALKMISNINGVAINDVYNKEIIHEKLGRELTDKQHMVLYLVINKYSGTEISQIIKKLGHSITPAAVNDYITKLKYMFGVNSKLELIAKAIDLNYHTYIPRKFLKVGIYEINDKVYSHTC